MANGQPVQDPRAIKAAQLAQMQLAARGPAAADTTSSLSIDPTRAATMSALQWPSESQASGTGGSSQVLPPTNPINPTAIPDPYQIASGQLARQHALAERLTPLLAREDAMSRPQSPTNPEGIPRSGLADERWMKMQRVSGHGVGGNVKNIFGDIGRAMLTLLVSTGPGRAFEQAKYGPGNRQYERRRGEVAEQLQNIKGQEEIEQKPIGPMGELAYHQGLLGTKEEQNRIRQQLADEKTKNDPDKTDIERQKVELARQKADQAVRKWRQQYGVELKNFQLKAKNLDRETARDQMDNMLRDQGNRNYAARTAAGQSETEARLANQADIAQAKIDADKWFQRSWGIQPKIPPRAGGGGGKSGSSRSVVDDLVKKHGG